MKKIKNGLSKIPGFKFSAVKAEIRYTDRLDFSLILSETPCNASGLFTKNKIFAAPVKLCRELINNPINAILINATNANACTGTEGYKNVITLTNTISEQLNLSKESVLMASTGIIGVQLPANKMLNSIPKLINNLSSDSGSLIAKAIMTTDTFPKESAYSFKTSLEKYYIGGIAKGSGMIAPDMATLLAFIITNAPIKKTDLDRIFKKSVQKSFNSITIDGDMSTNDTALILSPIKDDYLSNENDLLEFENTLNAVLTDLAKMLVKDGEGSTKCVEINISGARNENDAKNIAKSVAESLLVKTALFGEDPNWGRIACAAGYSNAEFNPDNLNINFNDIEVYKNGMPTDFDLKKVEKIMQLSEYKIFINIGSGKYTWKYLTTDISYDYVKINSEYSS